MDSFEIASLLWVVAILAVATALGDGASTAPWLVATVGRLLRVGRRQFGLGSECRGCRGNQNALRRALQAIKRWIAVPVAVFKHQIIADRSVGEGRGVEELGGERGRKRPGRAL